MKGKLSLLTVVFLMLITFLFNCSIDRSISKTPLDISPNEGILITKLHSNIVKFGVCIAKENHYCGEPVWTSYSKDFVSLSGYRYYYPSENDYDPMTDKGTRVMEVEKDDLLKVFRFDSGKAYFSKLIVFIKDGPYDVFLKPYYFYIEPGTVTYIGDLHLEWRIVGKLIQDKVYVSHKIADNEDETMAEAKEKYPWIFEKYPYKKNIPEITLETVEGFEEVEELKYMKEK